jgi:hypothetical protein
MRNLRVSAIGIFTVFLFLWGFASALFADGGYFPDRAIKKLPGIPAQRALLTWKDSTETLVISSTLDSEAQKLGWLIPLPSVPTEMSKADPGSLKTLAFCVQPRITHDLTLWVWSTNLIVGWFALAVVLVVFRPSGLVSFFMLTFLVILLAGMLLPSLKAGGSGARASKIQLEKTAKVGSYDIAVVKAKAPTDLNQWLTGNGFASLPAVAEPTVLDYVRRGWVFVAIKLTREDSGESTPHPIKLVFSAKEPVYPWKLTKLAGGQPRLELFVAGPSRAVAWKLKAEFCQRFSGGGVFHADAAAVSIGHPQIVPLLWDGCVVTKLSGRVDARRQADDLSIHWTDFEPYQQHFFTTTGAASIAWILFISVLGVVCIPGMILCKTRNGQRFDGKFYFGRLLPRTLLVGLALAGIAFCFLPKLGSSEIQVFHFGGVKDAVRPYQLRARVGMIIYEQPDILRQDVDSIVDAILHSPSMFSRRSGLMNALQGGLVHVESSPGNFTVEKVGGKIIVKVYDESGLPLTETYAVPEQKPIVSKANQ